MKYADAIKALEKLEGGSEIARSIEAEVDALKAKNTETSGKASTAQTKASGLETALMGAAKAIGVEGDIDVVVGAIEEKSRTLASDLKATKTKLTEVEAAKSTAETKLAGLERKSKIADIAAKSGANAAVLERLFVDSIDTITIDGDTVKVGDKTLKEHVEATADLSPFAAALFPANSDKSATAPPTQTGVKLPGTAPGTTSGTTPDRPLDAYMGRYDAVTVLAGSGGKK